MEYSRVQLALFVVIFNVDFILNQPFDENKGKSLSIICSALTWLKEDFEKIPSGHASPEKQESDEKPMEGKLSSSLLKFGRKGFIIRKKTGF